MPEAAKLFKVDRKHIVDVVKQSRSCYSLRDTAGLRFDMAIVHFSWDALLVDVRRDVCPLAKWDKAKRSWIMTADEADAFLKAAQGRMHAARVSCTVKVDDALWILGFAKDTPRELKGAKFIP